MQTRGHTTSSFLSHGQRIVLILPLIVLIVGLIMAFGWITSSALMDIDQSFSQLFLRTDDAAFTGILVDRDWWQVFFLAVTEALYTSLFQVLLGLVLFALVHDSLGLATLRLTIVVLCWLVPVEDYYFALGQLSVITGVFLPEQAKIVLSSALHYGSSIALFLYVLWPPILRHMQDTFQVYPPPALRLYMLRCIGTLPIIFFVWIYRFIANFQLNLELGDYSIQYLATSLLVIIVFFAFAFAVLWLCMRQAFTLPSQHDH